MRWKRVKIRLVCIYLCLCVCMYMNSYIHELLQGVVTSIYLVVAPATMIKVFDQQNSTLIFWSTQKYPLDRLILILQPIDFLIHICNFNYKSNSDYVAIAMIQASPTWTTEHACWLLCQLRPSCLLTSL